MLSPVRLNAQLGRMGQDMTWARASFCPCRDVSTGGARQGCPVCGARGVIWEPPVASRAGISGMKVQREWMAYGQYESGDTVVSVPSDTPLYAAGENDRVVMVQSSQSYDVVFVHGDPSERLLFTVIDFDRCFWLNPGGTAIIEGGLPTQIPGYPLVWGPGQLEPPAGTQYTLRGRRIPEYFMYRDLAQDRAHYGGLALPRRLVLRKFDLFGR